MLGVNETGGMPRWLKHGEMATGPQGGAAGRRRRWTPEEKFQVVLDAAAAGESGLGALLRREGLHEADLERFREEVREAATRGFATGRRKRGLSPEEKQVRRLKKELARKEKALADRGFYRPAEASRFSTRARTL
jgi:transposase